MQTNEKITISILYTIDKNKMSIVGVEFEMNKRNTWIIPAIVAAVLGIILGVLFYNGTIEAAIILTPIIFATVFAGVSLILLFIAAIFTMVKETRACLCEYGNPLILGTAGTLLAGFLALTVITFIVAGSFAAALLIGLLGFFFIFAAIIFILLVICLVNAFCCRKHECCKFDKE